MQKFGGNIVVLNFRDTYHEVGNYEFKIVLDKKKFKSGHTSTISMMNADRNDVFMDVKKWGRKINCSFSINENDPNGVYVVRFHAIDCRGKVIDENFHCWVIK